MLRWIVSSSLQYRIVVVIAAVVFLIVGIILAGRAPLDVFPEFAPPLVEIQTEAPGMSSEAVEQVVTIPLESALNGLPLMTSMRSKSVQGISSIQLLFEQSTDVLQARQMVGERVAMTAGSLSTQVKAPRVLPPLSSVSRVLKLGLKPKAKDKLAPGEREVTLTDISVMMHWLIEPRLRAVPGVANVSTYGMREKEYQILVNPADLRAYGVTLEQVKQAARRSVIYGSAGFHDTPNQRLAVQYGTEIDRPQDLGRVVVASPKGQPVLLHQIATLTTGNPPAIGAGVVNDDPGLLTVIEKYPWANALEVTRNVEAAIANLAPALPGVDMTTGIFRPATFIERSLSNLEHAILIGCALVAVILVAFLFEWRAALISLTAIPLSIVAALVVLSRMGSTLNTMVLAGLAIAVGEVVDDAIIDVENIIRRLRLNAQLDPKERLPLFRVVLDASLEVRSAVVFATFIVACVCLPIFSMSGVAGSFFRPLAMSYLLAVLASLGVALTVTPALSLILLPRLVRERPDGQPRRHAVPPLVRLVRAIYRRLLPLFLNWPIVAFLLLLGLFGGAAYLLPQLKEEYLPHFQESDFLTHWIAKPGTSIPTMERDVCQVSKELRQETPVKEFGSQIARAELGEDVVGPNFAELWVSLGDYQGDYEDARHKIEAVLERHPGFESDLITYLQERIEEVLSGSGASVVVRIYGPDLATLRDKAQAAKAAIEGGPKGAVHGVTGLKVESQVLVPQLHLAIDPRRTADYGLTPADVVDQVSTLLNGTKVGEVRREQKTFDLVVWGSPEVRRNVAELRRLEIDLTGGQGTVPLGAVARLEQVNALNTIRHDQSSRAIDVTCNIRGQDLGGIVHEIESRLTPLHQEGYRVTLMGEYQARMENQRQLLGVTALALIGIALLLYIDFRSVRLTILVLLTLPFALIGGVAAAYLTGGVLSLGSLVGFIAVLGIAGRNGIMLIGHYRHLREEEKVEFGRELILRGAEERVAPILMTALAAGLGLLPLALGKSKPGYEIEYPMAIVILGGLFTSTLLNLLILPVFYERFGRKAMGTVDAV